MRQPLGRRIEQTGCSHDYWAFLLDMISIIVVSSVLIIESLNDMFFEREVLSRDLELFVHKVC